MQNGGFVLICFKKEITCGEYQLDLIAVDDDLLSLELDSSYKECYLVGHRICGFDCTDLNSEGWRSYMSVLCSQGTDEITNNFWNDSDPKRQRKMLKSKKGIYYFLLLQLTFGFCVKLVVDMLLRMRKEMKEEESSKPPEIDQLILIDRDIDLITPMCTELTYEGLIDEIFGITYSTTELLEFVFILVSRLRGSGSRNCWKRERKKTENSLE